MITALDIRSDDHIIEVGPGLGALTIPLAKKTAHITAVEIDPDIATMLGTYVNAEAPQGNVEILNEDILKFTVPRAKYKVIGSLPYYITSPIINHFFKDQFMNPEGKTPEIAVFLIQKEVAEKICARPGDMNVLALNVQTFGMPELIARVPKEAFTPEPKVDSAIIRITRYQKPAVSCALKPYFNIISRAFSGKRKKLSNTLRDLKDKLTELGLADLRPQNLTIRDWENLT